MAPGGPSLVLASGSATRRALMEAAGLAFTVAVPSVDESAIKHSIRGNGGSPEDAATALAHAKASTVSPGIEAVVIGADQILVCDGEWFDKPSDITAARAQLARLRGREHDLVTAVTCWRAGRAVWSHLARPRLTMRAFSERFMHEFLTTEGDAVLASVGCYRLEGLGVHLFETIGGEHAAILGLPLLPLLQALRDLGVVQA